MIRRIPSLTTRRKAPPIWQTLMEVEPDTRASVRRSNRGTKSPDHDVQEGLYIISVAARLLEMHPQTLRKYERIGLVRPSRTIGMLRLYSEEDLAQLRAIKHLVEDLHLNLAGVELIMEMVKQPEIMLQEIQKPTPLPQQITKTLSSHHLENQKHFRHRWVELAARKQDVCTKTKNRQP